MGLREEARLAVVNELVDVPQKIGNGKTFLERHRANLVALQHSTRSAFLDCPPAPAPEQQVFKALDYFNLFISPILVYWLVGT